MDIVAIIGIVLALVIGGVAGWIAARRGATSEIETARNDAAATRERAETDLAFRAAAETRLSVAQEAIGTLIRERDDAFSQRNQAKQDLIESEKRVALAEQSVANADRRMADWEKARDEAMQNAKATVLEVGNTLSTKLLADHKQETEAAKKEAAESLAKTTKALNEQFESVVKTVASLNHQVEKAKEVTDTVWRALSSPGGAGHFAEIGLENALKSFGLERSRDFMIQQAIGGDGENARLRPDATVFLPFESVLIIDCKASKFIVELAAAEGTEGEKGAFENLARTMNVHLRSLAAKDYRAAVLANYRAAGRSGEIRRVLNVMYLQNDAFLEKVTQADPDFQKKAAAAEIIVAGPTGLAGIIGFARIEIDLGRQAENQERIIDAVQSLLEGIGFVISSTENVGKGIKAAADGFVKLSGSINARLLPRTRRLTQLGVRPSKAKPLPSAIRSYQVVELDGHTTIEGEAEEVSATAIADQSGAKVD